MQTIYLDISNKGVYPCIYAKQGDIGRQFTAIINDNGVPFDIPADASVSAWYGAKNNAGSYDSVEVNGNVVVVTISQQATLTHGTGVLCLSISYANGDEISTWNIPYDVEIKPGTIPIYPDEPAPDGGISETEFEVLFNINLNKNMDKITESVIASLPVYNGEVR